MTIASKKNCGTAALIVTSLVLSIHAAYATPLEVRRDAREPGFAQVMYEFYQDQPYDALTTLLANSELAFNATGTGNVLLGNLYTRYGLPREAEAALTRAGNSDVTANNRNDPWLSYGKLVYETGQYSLALNFLRDPPLMLSPKQESERMVMVTNILARTDHADEAVEALQSFQTPLAYYRKLARYNLALSLLQKKRLDPGQTYSAADLAQQKQFQLYATRILEDLMLNKIPKLTPIIKPTVARDISVRNGDDRNGWFAWFSGKTDAAGRQTSLIENHELGNASTFTRSALTGGDVIDATITPREVSNLTDKIALSLAYLRLLRNEPDLAKTALRNVQLDSPYSNQALLTSAHIYYRLGDYARSYNFSNELTKRNPADPLVQEGWMLSASALEDQHNPNAADRYRAAIQIYKEQTAAMVQFDEDIEKLDVLKTFPVEASDPILLGLPKIPQSRYSGLWAQLLERSEVLSILQQIQQTQLLQSKIVNYEKQLTALEAVPNQTREDRTDIKAARVLFDKVKDDFEKSGAQDHKALLGQIRVNLKEKQLQIDHYLTESLLGLQRVSSKPH
jgi:hypothetical protein